MNNSITYRDGYKYQLVEPYVVQTNVLPKEHTAHDFIILAPNGVLMVKAGYAWDGPSGPTIDTKNFLRGSLVHDALYQLMRHRLLDLGWRETADEELVRICKEDGMWAIRRWWVLRAVRLAGENGAKWQEETILTAP